MLIVQCRKGTAGNREFCDFHITDLEGDNSGRIFWELQPGKSWDDLLPRIRAGIVAITNADEADQIIFMGFPDSQDVA